METPNYEFNFNQKQKGLIRGLMSRNDSNESPEYRRLKLILLFEEKVELTTDAPYSITMNVESIRELESSEKITAKICRDTFSFVPNQITVFDKLSAEVSKYQTRSIMIRYTLSQDENNGRKVVSIPSRQKVEELKDSTGGLIVLKFYDNDTKIIMYEHKPMFTNTPKEYTVQHGSVVEGFRFGASCIQFSLAERGSTTRRRRPRGFNLSGVNQVEDEYRLGLLDYWNIGQLRTDMAMGISSNITCVFNEGLL